MANTQHMTLQRKPEVCPYCGEQLSVYQIPNSNHFMTLECECQGAKGARRDEYVERRSSLLRMAWERTGVPKRYLDVEPDYEAIKGLEDGIGLYLYGTRGVGKTYAACAALKGYVSRHTNDSGWCSARFISANRWLDSIQETFGRWNASAEDAFQKAAGTGLLVIDDFGKLNSKVNDWALGKLFSLVNERYSDMRPTIFTSKYSLSQLAEKFDAVDRETSGDMISRIREMCRGVEMTGVDRRLAV